MKSIFITSLLCLLYTIGYSQNHKYFKLLNQQRTDTICTNDSMYKIHYTITNTEGGTYIKICTEKLLLYKIPPHLLELKRATQNDPEKLYCSRVNSIIYNKKTVTAAKLSFFLLWERTYSKDKVTDTLFYKAFIISILSQTLLLLCFFGLQLLLNRDFKEIKKEILSIPNEIQNTSIKHFFNEGNIVLMSAYLVISSLISTIASQALFDIVYGEVFIGYVIYNTIILSILLLIMRFIKFE